jgi:hemerythrin-like domain-containing protein
MNTPIKILSDEHQSILKVVSVLVNECNALESGKALDKNFFIKAINFIKNYADKFHHAKEEDILFVELRKDSAQMHCNPTSQMLFEHDLGRNFIKNTEEGLEENNDKKIIENARGYARMIQEHIFKEDNILYPMAEEALNKEIWESVSDKFKEAKIKFGEEIKQCMAVLEEFGNREC